MLQPCAAGLYLLNVDKPYLILLILDFLGHKIALLQDYSIYPKTKGTSFNNGSGVRIEFTCNQPAEVETVECETDENTPFGDFHYEPVSVDDLFCFLCLCN